MVREDQPWRLKVYTLGGFQLEKDRAPLVWTGKEPARPLTLLKVLIACGGEASESDLTDALWPEALGDAAHKALSVTLTRLRRLLGIEGILEYHRGHLALNADLCWVDVWAFEALIQDAEKTGKGGKAQELAPKVVQKLNQALALYRGPFLYHDASQSWAIPLRARLHNRFIHLVGDLGDHWERHKKWKKAEECYQGGLAIDDACEEFYLRLMACLIQQQHYAEARRMYEQCTELLRIKKNTKPGSEIQALANELLRK